MTREQRDHILEEELSIYIDGYVDGDPASTERERIESHISNCEQCSELLEDLRRTQLLLSNLERESAPERFSRHVEGRIRRRSRGRFFHHRWQSSSRTIYLGAAIVLVILAALYLFSQVGFEVRDAETGLTGEELGKETVEEEKDGL